MEDYYKPITTIAYAIYALPKQCSQEEIKGIINFVEESFFITLPDKIKSHFTNEIFTHEYISFFSSKVVNSSNYNDEQKLILTLKEVIDYLEVSRIDVKKSISSSHSLNQLESAIRNNNLLAYSIRGLLEVCNVKYEQKEEQGKKDLLLCSQANHFPSMMLLSNYERKHNNLLESCYWLELAYRLFPYFFTSNMINMKNKLEQEVNFQESNLMKKVINDEEYHHFMFKKNVDGLENLVLNKEMIKAVYSSFYPISQLEKINDKYDNNDVIWKILSSLSGTNSTPIYNVISNTKYKSIQNVMQKVMKEETNQNIIVIECLNEVDIYGVKKFISNLLPNTYCKMIDTNTIVPMELDPEFSTSNFFCNGMTNNKSNKFILLFYNFDDEYFYTNKEIGMYIEDLLNMKKKYTFKKIDLSLPKDRMIPIILVPSFNVLPNEILLNSILLNCPTLSIEEKRQLLSEMLKINENQIDFNVISSLIKLSSKQISLLNSLLMEYDSSFILNNESLSMLLQKTSKRGIGF